MDMVGIEMVGVERGTTNRFPTTNVTKNYQQNQRDKIVSKKNPRPLGDTNITKVLQKCYKDVSIK